MMLAMSFFEAQRQLRSLKPLRGKWFATWTASLGSATRLTTEAPDVNPECESVNVNSAHAVVLLKYV
jgi:hypothetical protein